MIIWLDGTYGVGKSTIASKIMEYFFDGEAELLESDVYSEKLFKQIIEEAKQKNLLPQTGGLPQYDMTFINSFREMIEKKNGDYHKKLLVDMALTSRECKEGIIDPLMRKYKDILHIILVASEESIKLRIKKDTKRPDKILAIGSLLQNISFLQDNFADAVRIATDDKSVDEVAEEIYQIIVDWEEKQMREQV